MVPMDVQYADAPDPEDITIVGVDMQNVDSQKECT
jgi:hypothetical protein